MKNPLQQASHPEIKKEPTYSHATSSTQFNIARVAERIDRPYLSHSSIVAPDVALDVDSDVATDVDPNVHPDVALDVIL